MTLLRRLLGRREAEAPVAGPTAPTDAELEALERDRERDLLRAEAERLDELRQRQLRYAEHAWTPPAQGGPRRADDTDATAGSGADANAAD